MEPRKRLPISDPSQQIIIYSTFNHKGGYFSTHLLYKKRKHKRVYFFTHPRTFAHRNNKGV